MLITSLANIQKSQPWKFLSIKVLLPILPIANTSWSFFCSPNVSQMTKRNIPEVFKGGGSLKMLLRTQKIFHRPLMSIKKHVNYI